jgi:hypothetical protein
MQIKKYLAEKAEKEIIIDVSGLTQVQTPVASMSGTSITINGFLE